MTHTSETRRATSGAKLGKSSLFCRCNNPKNRPSNYHIQAANKLRLKYLAGRLHDLGPKPLFHFLDEVARRRSETASGAVRGPASRFHGRQCRHRRGVAKLVQIYTSSGSGGALQITNSATGGSSTNGLLVGYNSSNDVIFNNQANTQEKFYTNNTFAMAISSGQQVGIGTNARATHCT
jgi:hypothetical protein